MDLLATVGIPPSIGHAYQACLVHLSPPDALIFEIPTVNAGSPRSIVRGKIATLYHKFVDDSMKGGVFV